MTNPRLKKTNDPNFYGFQVHEDWPLLALHPDARMTALAWATVSEGKIDDIGVINNIKASVKIIKDKGLACGSFANNLTYFFNGVRCSSTDLVIRPSVI